MLSIYLKTLNFRKFNLAIHCLFILKNVASLCKAFNFAISVKEFFQLYDPYVNFKIDLINSAFLIYVGPVFAQGTAKGQLNVTFLHQLITQP